MKKNPYEPIFREIANILLTTAEVKPNFTDSAFFDATIIFQTAFIDKIYDFQNVQNIPLEQQKIIAELAGTELRKLILKYTNLDTFILAKNK